MFLFSHDVCFRNDVRNFEHVSGLEKPPGSLEFVGIKAYRNIIACLIWIENGNVKSRASISNNEDDLYITFGMGSIITFFERLDY